MPIVPMFVEDSFESTFSWPTLLARGGGSVEAVYLCLVFWNSINVNSLPERSLRHDTKHNDTRYNIIEQVASKKIEFTSEDTQ